jgi:hypothetical protein
MGRRFRKATARTRLDRGPIAIEYRWDEGCADRMAEIATAFVRLDVHCHARNLTGLGGQAGDLGHPDRVRKCGRPRLATGSSRVWRPGGNVTGLSIQGSGSGQ